MINNSCQELDSKQTKGVRAMLTEFQDVFAIDEKDKGRTSITKSIPEMLNQLDNIREDFHWR